MHVSHVDKYNSYQLFEDGIAALIMTILKKILLVWGPGISFRKHFQRSWSHLCWGLNSHCFRMVGDGQSGSIYCIKGGMTIPNRRSLDHGTFEVISSDLGAGIPEERPVQLRHLRQYLVP